MGIDVALHARKHYPGTPSAPGRVCQSLIQDNAGSRSRCPWHHSGEWPQQPGQTAARAADVRYRPAGTSIGALSITDDVADGLLRNAGKTLQGLQDTLDSGAPVPGVQIPDVTLTAVIGLQQERRTGRNVLARLSVASSRRRAW